MSLAKYIQSGVHVALQSWSYNFLYNFKDDLDRNLNDLFSCPSICVALAVQT